MYVLVPDDRPRDVTCDLPKKWEGNARLIFERIRHLFKNARYSRKPRQVKNKRVTLCREYSDGVVTFRIGRLSKGRPFIFGRVHHDDTGRAHAIRLNSLTH